MGYACGRETSPRPARSAPSGRPDDHRGGARTTVRGPSGRPCPIHQEIHTLSFADLGLSAELLRAVADEGFTEPTPIQQQAIPVVIAGHDVLGTAQTGTGKTAAFVLPILQRLARHANSSFSPARHPVRALILAPTRELAVQVAEMATAYGRHTPLRTTVVYGGVPIDPQAKTLLAGVEILVATPGRLLDHMGSRTVNLGQVEILVLDEADRMLDMGFLPDLRRILDALPSQRQNLLFSATFSGDVRSLADQILDAPVRIAVAPANATADNVRQIVYPVDRDRKEELLAHLIRRYDLRQVLVFTRTKLAAARLATWLDRRGVEATAIHGDRNQAERSRALESFKAGEVRVLVATDVAARGLDIEELPHVVNFELPFDPQDYIHRIGRTARAGSDGDAISLVCIDEADLLRGVQRLLKRAIPWTVEEGFVPDRDVEPRPVRIPTGRRSGSPSTGSGAAGRGGRRPVGRAGRRSSTPTA
jgi:ATP-dependent RNA helicase RhlE